MAVPALTGDTFLDSLIASRNNLVAALAGETARWANLVAAGQEPPASYSLGGRSLTYTEWVREVNTALAELDKTIQAKGGETGAFGDAVVHGYLG